MKVKNPNCEKCKERDECDIYQSWLSDKDCCCPIICEQREKERNRGKR